MSETVGTKAPEVQWPTWLLSVEQALAIHPQFVLSGNIRDQFLVPVEGAFIIDRIIPVLWEMLSRNGYVCLFVYDPVKGIRVYPEDDDEAHSVASEALKGAGYTIGSQVLLEELAGIIESIAVNEELAAAFVVDYASRIPMSASTLSEVEKEFFVACERLADTVTPLPSETRNNAPCYNPIIWLAHQESDLPSWFSVGNALISSHVLGMPTWQQRRQAAEVLAKVFPNAVSIEERELNDLLDKFADSTDGLSIQNMMSVAQLARSQSIELAQLENAVRGFKVGISDNPWKQAYLIKRIRSGHKQLSDRVKGQETGLQKTLDILVRSVVGLSGAQAKSSGSRPKGVLFFAGPTGVGKTELAKAITKLVFGDEQAYIRFDMSEFSAEHSEARLLGAPPGYIGHDAGGELVNAIRQRPFSLVLFDEIEKAHPRILDKFLQILEDGRITDGRGSTVYFSEAIIVFTSNLGVFLPGQDGERIQNVSFQDTHAEIEEKITKAIKDFFQFELQRPEILNRIGENFVVFDFIRPGVAKEILEKMLGNISEKVSKEHSIELSFSPEALETLLQEVTTNLEHGGRGIGNKLEEVLINPLSWLIFERAPDTSPILVEELYRKDGSYRLVVG